MENNFFELILKNNIYTRIEKRFYNLLSEIPFDNYYIAGNSLNAEEPKDFDLFPIENSFDFNLVRDKVVNENNEILNESTNAFTTKINGKIVQFCTYTKPSLEELVKSFDFSHVQVGIEVRNKNLVFDSIYFTEKYVEWKLTNKIEFIDTSYPLSSLIRYIKYIKRYDIPKRQYGENLINILCAIVKRGFKDYEDLKDQLEAIDLAFILNSETRENLIKTFNIDVNGKGEDENENI